MTPSPDGLLRLSRAELNAVRLQHLWSGLDDEVDATDAPAPRCGAASTLSGYTEWVSPQASTLTLGWDWQLVAGSGRPSVVRLGLPRTNIQVIDECAQPLPWEHNLEVLADFIDGMPWAEPAFGAVCERHAG